MSRPVVPRRTSIGAVRNPESDAAILKAARDLLAERGYADFSLSEVARRAHASKPTLYRRWPNKAALIFDVYDAERGERMTIAETGDFPGDMVAIVSGLWRLWRETPTGPALRALIAEAQGETSAIETLRKIHSPRRPDIARARIERAIADGVLVPDFDIDTALTLMMAFNWSQLLTDEIGDETIIAPVIALIFGLRPR